MELYNCTVICSGPLCFVRPCGLPFDRVTSLGSASVISTATITHPFFCVCICEIPLCVFPPSGGKILNYDKSLCPLRLRGCCSWCRSALLRKLKEKNERGDWESSRVKVKYCDIWDEAGEGVCLDKFSQSNGWKWVFRCCLVFVLQCSRNANNDHKFLGLRLHFYAVLPSPESFSKACCPPPSPPPLPFPSTIRPQLSSCLPRLC